MRFCSRIDECRDRFTEFSNFDVIAKMVQTKTMCRSRKDSRHCLGEAFIGTRDEDGLGANSWDGIAQVFHEVRPRFRSFIASINAHAKREARVIGVHLHGQKQGSTQASVEGGGGQGQHVGTQRMHPNVRSKREEQAFEGASLFIQLEMSVSAGVGGSDGCEQGR